MAALSPAKNRFHSVCCMLIHIMMTKITMMTKIMMITKMMMTIMLMKKITLVTSFEEISISVLGISSKLRTHNLDFTWIPQLVAILTITITNYHYQCILAILTIAMLMITIFTLKSVNCFLARGPMVQEMKVHWESPQLSWARNASSPATFWSFFNSYFL